MSGEDHSRVRHALWNQDQCDCGRISGGWTDATKRRASNAGDKIASQPTEVWGTSVRRCWESARGGAILYLVIHPNMGNKLLT